MVIITFVHDSGTGVKFRLSNGPGILEAQVAAGFVPRTWRRFGEGIMDSCYGNSVIRLTQLKQTRMEKMTGRNRPFLLWSLLEDPADS
jgi:hypothetical protein